MRALVSHQCGLGSNPGHDAILWVEFLVGLIHVKIVAAWL